MPNPDNKRQKRGRPQDLRSALGLGRAQITVPTEQFMPGLPAGSRNVFIEPSARTVDQGSQISFGNAAPGPSSELEFLKGIAGGIQSGVQAYNQVNRYTTQKQQKEIDDILMDEEVLVQYQMDSEDGDKLRGGVELRNYEDSQRGQIVNNSTLRKNSAEYRSMQKELADFLAGKEGVVDPGFRLVEDPSRTFGLMHDRLQSAMGNMTADAKRYARAKIGELSQNAQIDYSRDQVRDLNNDYSAAKNIADQLAVINKYKEKFVPGTDEHDRLMELEARTEASHYDLREQTLINGVVDDFAGRWQSMGNDERRAIPDNWLLNSVLEDGTIATFLDVKQEQGEKDEAYVGRVRDALERSSALMARLEREDKKYRNERFELERKAVEEMEATQLQGVVERFSSGGYATRLEMLENGSYAVALERIYRAEHAGTSAPNGYLERKRTEAITAMVTDAADDGSLNALLSELGIDMDMPPEQQIERAVYILNKGQKKVAYDKDEARLTYAKYLQDEEDMIRNQAIKRGWNPTDDQLPDDLLDELRQLNAEKDRFTSASPKEQEQILTQLGFGAPSHDPDAALDDLVSSPKVSGWITSQYDKSVQEEENKYSRALKEWAETNALSSDPVDAPSFSDYVGANGFAADALMAEYGSSASFTVLNQEKDFLADLADLVSKDGDIPDQDPEEQFNMIMERVIPNAGQRRQAYRNLREAMSKQADDYAAEKKSAEQNQKRASAAVRQQREDELETRSLISTRSVGVVPTGDSNQANAQRIVNVTVGSHVLQNVAERISSPTGLMTTSAVFTGMTDDEMDMFLTSLKEGKAEGITAVFGGMAERMKDNPNALLELEDLTLLFNAQRFDGNNLRPGLFKSPVGRQLAQFAFADLLAADAVGRELAVPGMTDDVTGRPFTFGVKVTDDWKSKIRESYDQDIREPLRSVSQGTPQGRREYLESSMQYKELVLEYNARKVYHAELQRTGDKKLARDLERRYRSNVGLELSWSVIEDAKGALGLDDQSAVGLYLVSSLFPDGTIREGDNALVDMAMDVTLGIKGFTANYGREYENRYSRMRTALATVLEDRDKTPATILNGLYAVAIGIRDGDNFDTATDRGAGDGKTIPLSKQFDIIRPNLKGLIPGSQDLSDEDFDSLVLSLITADEGIVDMGLIPALSILNQDQQGIVRSQDINPEHFFRILLSGAQLADGRYAVPHASGGAVLVPPSHMLAPAKLELPNGNTLALSHDTRAGLRTVTDGRLLFSIIENPSNFQFDSQQELEEVQRVMEDYVGWLGESGYMNGGLDIVTAVLASEDIVRQVLGSNNNDRVAALPVPEGFKDRTIYSPYAMGPGVTASLTITADGREIRFPDPTLLAERFTAGAVFGQKEQGFVAGASGQQRLYGLNPDNQQEESNRNEYALMVGDRNYIVGIGDNATFGSGEYVGEYSLNSPMGSLMYLENQLEEAAERGLSTEGANSVAVGRLSFPGQAPMNLRDVTAEDAILVRDQLIEQSHHNIVQQMVSEGYFKTDDKGNVININQYVETDDGFVSAQVRLRELMHTPKLTIRYLENLVTPGQQEGELFFEAPRSGASGEPGRSILDTGILIPQEGEFIHEKGVPIPFTEGGNISYSYDTDKRVRIDAEGVERRIKVDPKFGRGRAFNPYFTAPQHKKITKIEGAKVLPVRGDRFPMPQGESRVYIESADGHRDVTTDWDIFGLSIGGTPTNSVRDMTRYYNPNGSLRPQVGRVGIEERLPFGPRTSDVAVGTAPQLNTEGTLAAGVPVQRLPGRVDLGSPENKPIYDYIRKNHPEVEFNRIEKVAPGPGFEGSTSIHVSNIDGNELARIMINASAFAHRANLGLESSDMPGADAARARFDYDGSTDVPPLALEAFIAEQRERMREAAGAMGPPRTTPDTGGAPEDWEERQRAIVALSEGERPIKVLKELEQFFDSFSTDPGDFGNISYDQAPMIRAEQKRRLTKLKNLENLIDSYTRMGTPKSGALERMDEGRSTQEILGYEPMEYLKRAQEFADRYNKVLEFYEKVPLDQYIQYLDDKNMLPPGYEMSVMGTVFEDRPIRGRNPYKGE